MSANPWGCVLALASSLAATTALASRKPDVMQHPNLVIGYMNMGVPVARLESSVASFTRWASPPESVVADCPR